VITVAARDPVARYRALTSGAHLSATIPANAVLAGRLTAEAFAPLFYGSAIPGLPAPHTTEPLEFALSVERSGEGARAEFHADAPIATATEIRAYYSMIQEMQQRMMQQMMEQQRQMQQRQQGGMMGGPRPGPREAAPLPELPEPPRLQLQPPR
jgi:hypothetical protein